MAKCMCASCVFLFFIIFLAGLGSSLQGADAPAAPIAAAGAPKAPVPPSVPVDKKVEALLLTSSQFYAGLQSFETDITSVTKVEMTGMKQEMDSSYHVALSHPNSFALILQSGMVGGSLISDGKTLTTYQPMLKKYTVTDAPAQLSDLLQPMNLLLSIGGLPLGLESLLNKDALKMLETHLAKSEDVGLEKIGTASAHHIRLVGTPYVTDLWITDGAAPFLLQSQVSMDMSGMMKNLSAAQKSKMPTGFAMMSMVRTNSFTNWKMNQPVAASVFQFQPPPDAQLVAEFYTPPPHPLVGKGAPDFTLNDLDGKAVSLSSLKGKVVVLDFWATWCGPCVATLPTVSEVTSSFKDRGVVFYAVNLKENADQIRKFQTDKVLSFPVLLDSKGTVADLYLAKSIPESVVIDKSGNIQAVHVGFSSSLKKTLTQQLNDVLDGKQLAPAKAIEPTKGT